MKKTRSKTPILLLIALLWSGIGYSQTNSYNISFENAVQHEAVIEASFPQVEKDTLTIRMSRTSPGRYALHEFIKNVYDFSATDSENRPLEILRTDPYSWKVFGHDGEVNIRYRLFANRADGTYSQIDETHAHLNIPATFAYAESLQDRPIEVQFDLTGHPEWKIATQLKNLNPTTFFAPDLYYFMDSPVEISDFDSKSFEVNGQEIKFILHHPGSTKEFEDYVEKVKKIVEEEKEVFGELPEFDFGKYVFLACYMPQVAGDGMEHRNSTVLTSVRSLEEGGSQSNLGTVSHEFFHAWNVERIRPASLEPFAFDEVNMSGELWFAEGFTSYYTDLILLRAGLISPEEYLDEVQGTFNYVWNSPGRQYFSPVQMSYQAPMVDAATSVDPVNRENTFISYYSYGSSLGLALDLALRQKGLNLDDFMKLMWKKYGIDEKTYTVQDIEETLMEYAGKDFAQSFFKNYIYNSKMPDYDQLFQTMGISLVKAHPEQAYIGAQVIQEDNYAVIAGNPKEGSPAYKAGLSQGDKILAFEGEALDHNTFRELLTRYSPGDTVELLINRYGKIKSVNIALEANPEYKLEIVEEVDELIEERRNNWLSGN